MGEGCLIIFLVKMFDYFVVLLIIMDFDSF